MTKKTNKANKYEGKVFMANQKFFDQKVSNLFRGEGNKTYKDFPTYFGVRRHDLEVYIDLYEGKYYLAFKRMGYALGDYSKRIRKNMTMAEVDALIADYYDQEDALHQKCMETWNKAFPQTKKTKRQTKQETKPVAEIESEPKNEIGNFVKDWNERFEDELTPIEDEAPKTGKTLKVQLNSGECVWTCPQSYVIQVWKNGRWENIAVFSPDQYESALNTSKWINAKNVQIVTLY